MGVFHFLTGELNHRSGMKPAKITLLFWRRKWVLGAYRNFAVIGEDVYGLSNGSHVTDHASASPTVSGDCLGRLEKHITSHIIHFTLAADRPKQIPF
jgi:hypothetical protein